VSVQLRTLAGTRTRKKPGNPSDKIPARSGSNPVRGRVQDGPLAPAGIPVPVSRISCQSISVSNSISLYEDGNETTTSAQARPSSGLTKAYRPGRKITKPRMGG
jgi:hypothetical protein